MKRMIGAIIFGIILIIATVIVFYNKDKKTTLSNKVVVAEVTHSIFYAPWYVALHNNYFDDLDVEVVLTSGANNVVAAVLSGDANIGLCGPEATIYVYNEKKNDYVKSFAGLTKRDGQFLVLRNNVKIQNIKEIDGLNILAGRAGGMPLLSFKSALKNMNLKKVKIDTSVDFANLTSAFISGKGDGVNLFEHSVTINTRLFYLIKSLLIVI